MCVHAAKTLGEGFHIFSCNMVYKDTLHHKMSDWSFLTE